jgi:chromate transport protein ChrA
MRETLKNNDMENNDLNRKLFFIIPILTGIICFILYCFLYEYYKEYEVQSLVFGNIIAQPFILLSYYQRFRDNQKNSKKDNTTSVFFVIGIQLAPILVMIVIVIIVFGNKVYKYFKEPLKEGKQE